MSLRRIKIIIWCVCLLLVTAGTASAKGWRGLIPLHSTRQDVEHVLGKPIDSYYHSRNETVLIDFSSGTCQGAEPYSYKVAVGTVTRIMVVPKSETSVNVLRVDLTRYKKKVDGNIEEHIFYYDDEGGECIEVFDGKVQSTTYTPTASEASLRCYSSFDDWMTANNIACILQASKFDAFGAIPIDEERVRLDNLALQLKSQSPVIRGWIMVYGVKTSGRKAIVRRANRIKHYLVKQRGVASGRVLIKAAGTLDEPLVEMWISFVGEALPTFRP